MGYIGYPSIRDSALTWQDGFYLHIIKSPHRVKKMYEIKHFAVLQKYRWSQHKNPYHREHNVTLTNFSRPFLAHHVYKLSQHRSGEVDFKEIMYLLSITNLATPQHENSQPRAHEFTIQLDLSNPIITFNFIVLINALEKRTPFLIK